jgi:uncharacterized membrane protein YraQ (UPF0718 family)/copper chaperone CopZ
VVPVAASLKKSGASNGAVVSFLITTPTSGADSIAATYSLLGGVFTVARVAASFIIGLAAGLLAALVHTAPASSSPADAAPKRPSQSIRRRLIEPFSYGFDELLGGMAKSLAFGILLSGVITYFLPEGFLEHTVGHGMISYLAMMAFGIPLYVCASGSIPLAASLLAKGISPGAALVFLITGPATNAAVIAVISKMLGKKSLAIFLGSLAVGSIGAGLALDAFAGLFPMMIPNIKEHCAHDQTGILEYVSAALLGLMILFHLIRPLQARMFAKKGPVGMLQLRVPDMTCQHCVKTITAAVNTVGGVKSVQADPNTKAVAVDLDNADNADAVIKAITNAGYSPEKA